MRITAIVIAIVVVVAFIVPVGVGMQRPEESDPVEITVELVTERVPSVIVYIDEVIQRPVDGPTIEVFIDKTVKVVVYIINVIVLFGEQGGGDVVQPCSGDPAYFEIADLSAPDSVARAENATVEATIENTGGVEATQNVTFLVEGKNVTTGSGAVDIVFLIDDSDSMSEEISTVKRDLKDFSSHLESEDVDAEFAVVTFTGEVQVRQDFTDDVSQTQATIDQVSTEGGFELNYRAIETALNSSELSPRSNARTVVIDITDETTDRDTDRDLTQEEIGDAIEDENAAYIAVSPNRSFIENDLPAEEWPNDPEYEGGSDRSLDKQVLAEKVENGTYFDLYNGSFSEKFREEISAEVVNISKQSAESVTLDCGESTSASYEVDTTDFPTGKYTVTVESENDSETTTFRVE